MLSKILEDARRLAWDAPREVMYHIRETPSGIVSITRPDQTGTAAHLSYAGGGDADILADIHSHCQMSAYFSETDDRDEQGLRFYGVIGRIFTQPEIRLRVGIYGDHWPVPITALFDGPGPFIDRYEENDSWKR
jgi:PRTRC genetic system protein A